jgi:hypothetical protein
MDFDRRDYSDERDPLDRDRDERDRDHDDDGLSWDVARVRRPSPITNVSATMIGTTRVTAPTIAIGTTPDGPIVIAIRETVPATHARCSRAV